MTEISIEGTRFFVNGQPTYAGISYEGKPVEGLLFNSRMVQAVYDDDNPQTVARWCYPDTGQWDPVRNTDEFCSVLPEYRRHGLLAVTVGLQGGGSIYEPEVYDHYNNSAFAPDGALKPAYFDRLERILAAADAIGMVVIVNYFYGKLLAKLEGDVAIRRATAEASQWVEETMPNVPTSSGRVVKCIANDGFELSCSPPEPCRFWNSRIGSRSQSGLVITLQTYRSVASSTYLGLAKTESLIV